MKIRKKIYFFSKKIGDKYGFDLPYLLENGFWVSLSQIAQILIGLGLSIVLARFTSETVLGQYNFLISILSVLSIISMPGVNISLLRSIARGKHGTYKEAVKFSFLWSLFGIPLFLFIAIYYYINDNQVIALGIFLSSLFFSFLYPFAKWDILLQGQTKFQLSTIYKTIKIATTSIFIATAVFFSKNNLILIFLSYLIANTFINLFFYFLSNKHIRNSEIDNDWKKSAYKLSTISLMSYIYDYADKILIGIFFEPSKLAIYSVAVSSIIYLRTAIKMLLRVIMPKLFKASQTNLRKILRKYGTKFLIILILGSIIFYFILPFLIKFLYSAKYENSIFYAQLYLISIPATGFVMFLQDYLIAFKEESLMIKVKAILTILNFVLYIVLIPQFGLSGAIVSSIIYYYLLLFIFAYFSYKK